MLSTSGLVPVAQEFAAPPGELKPVAPEWPITTMESSSPPAGASVADAELSLDEAVSVPPELQLASTTSGPATAATNRTRPAGGRACRVGGGFVVGKVRQLSRRMARTSRSVEHRASSHPRRPTR